MFTLSRALTRPGSFRGVFQWAGSIVMGVLFSLCPVSRAASAEGTGPVSEVDSSVQEVVVTARRREESLQSVPVSVSAFSAADLQSRSIQNIASVADFVPNVSFDSSSNSGGASGGANLFIRGVGQDDFLPTSDPGVGIYVDGVYLGRTAGSVFGTKDIESMEVLRGPQGTLFGRNTIGGALNITTAGPGSKLGQFLEVTSGSAGLLEVAGRLDGKLSDTVSGSLFADHRKRDGYARSVNSAADFGNENTSTFRGKVKFDLSERLRVGVSGDYYRKRQEATPSVNLATDFASTSNLSALYNSFGPSLLGGTPYTTADLASRNDPYALTKTGPSRDNADIWGIGLTADWSGFGWADLKSITAYRHLEVDFDEDSDATVHDIASTYDHQDQHQVSEELQLNGQASRLAWVTGLYLYDESASDFNTPALVPGLFSALQALPTSVDHLAPGPGFDPTAPITPGVPGGLGNPVNAGLDNELAILTDIRIKNAALYAHGVWQFTDRWSASVGLRGAYEQKKFRGYYYHRAAQYYSLPPTGKTASWKNVTPHAGIEFKPDMQDLLYASYDRGFKSGTFNGRANASAALQDVKPETVDSFELGWKSSFAEQRGRFSLAGFYSIYKDIQLIAVQPSASEVDVLLVNAARARIYGLEAELQAQVVRGLQLGVTGGYAHSAITQIDPQIAAATGVSVGNQLKKTPKLNFSTFAQYDLPVSYGEWSLRSDYVWRDKRYHDASNAPSTLEGSVGLLDAHVDFSTIDRMWDISAYGTNLTNKIVFNSIFLNAGGQTIGYAARGREYGAAVRFRF